MLFGIAASLAVNRVLQSQLVGVPPCHPLTMVQLKYCHLPPETAGKVECDVPHSRGHSR